ncbi:hypothetical protein P152DRAFT_367094, partial [Eremomyces bilateralis CBS 781.70]
VTNRSMDPYDYFTRIPVFGLIVCNECKYCVWPKDVAGHLSGPHHKLKRAQSQEIASAVHRWRGLTRSYEELQVPYTVDKPINALPLYEDGFMCIKGDCRKIFRGRPVIIEHWRTEHKWTVTERQRKGRAGRPGKTEKDIVQRRFEAATEKVLYQRFFPSRYSSQYFRKAEQKFQEIEKRIRTRIEAGEKDEANPWLERTGWAKYL